MVDIRRSIQRGRVDMGTKIYLIVSGGIFCLVAVAHLIRLVNGWSVEVGPWAAPLWVSWFGAVITAVLSICAFRLAAK